jgi:hypothetical protein
MSMSMSMSKSNEVSMSMSKSKSKKLTKKYVRELIEECGRMYNFDGKEALIKLNLEKEKVKKEKNKSFLLPFDGKKNEGCCNGIVKNHGLYTQCSKKVEGFCKTCEKEPYGNIDDRLKVGLYEYKDPKGKSPKRYLDVLKKKKINKEEVDEYCRKENIVIDNLHLEESSEKVKRGRPAKTENKVKVSTGKKGRPKKEKKLVEVTSSSEDDLFATLVAQANASSVVEEVKVEAPKVPKKVKEPNGNAKKGRPKKEKKEVELSSNLNEEVAPVVVPVVAPVVVPVVVPVEEEADVVKKIEYEGKKYYKSKKSGIIYNMEQDVVGKWNEESGKIDFEEEEEEEEEEEDEYDE